MSPAESSREENVYMAKLAEQAERMVECTEKVAKTVDGEELTVEEWNLRSVVCKNVINACRSSWRIISSIEQKEESRGNDDRVSMIKEYRGKIEGQLSKICVWILGLLDSHLIPSSTAVETKVFYLKMKGDYHRYLAEFKTGAEWKEAAESTLSAYESAKDFVLANLEPTHPTRVGLGVGLSYSVFYNEFLNSPDCPCNLAKQGTASSQPKGFNLSSGEFPALGSDKNPELNVRGHSSQGHPASSGAAAAPRERLGMSSTDGGSMEACTERGTVNTWKRVSPPYQGGPPASTEKWARDSQQAQPYPNMAMLHHPFDPWHAATPPIRTPPEGDWYGGGVPVGPYGPTGLPGTYPLEPSAYFHSQMAARPSSYPQPVPRPGCGPTGYTKNGESFRPLMSDSYMLTTCPVTPIRPGVCRGPLPFDGYYGPRQMGFCKTDEGDASVMGMAAGSGVHNRYQSQKFHPGSSNYHVRPGMAAGSGVHNRYQSQKFHPGSSNYHVRPGVHGSDPEVAKEHESPIGYSTHQGPYKVLLKQHDGQLDKDAEEKRGHSVATSVRGVDRRIGENNWGTDASNDEPMDFSKPAFGEDDTSSQPTGVHGRFSSVSIVGNEPNKTGLANTDSSLKIPETDAIPADHSQQLPDATKDTSTTLPPAKLLTGYLPMQSSNRTEAADGDKTSVESKQLELQVSGENIAGNSEVREKLHSQNQKRGPGCQSGAYYRGKGKLNTEETEEWRRKPPGTDSSSVTVSMEVAYTNVRVQDNNATQEGLEMHKGLSNQLGVEPYTISSCNTNNDNAQRERMKKIATQRAKQLQREEEERAKEQKAKALAKSEELNRWTLAGSSTHVKLDQSQQHKPEVTGHFSAPLKTDISSGEMPRQASNIRESFQSLHNSTNLKTLSQPSERGFNRLEESTDLPVPVEASGHASSCSAVKPAVSPVLMPDTGLDLASQVSVSQAFDDGVSRQKLMAHNKRKQNITQEKNLGDEQTTTGGGKIPIDMIVDANSSSDKANSTNDANNTNDTSVALKKKSNRSSKNKNKPDEPLVGTDVPLSASSGKTLKKISVESGKTQVSDPAPEISSLQTRISKEVVEGTYSQVPVSSMDLGLSQPSEEAHGSRVNQLRPQPPRRTSRNTKLDITSSKRQTQNSENRTHIPAPMEQAAGDSFTKDHGASEKVRKTTQKVQRGGGHNHTPTVKDLPSGVADKTEIKTLAFESIESGGRSISRSEGQGSGERMVSQWQPKSQAYPAHNRQGNRGNDKVMGSQRNAAQVGRASGKDFPSQGLESIPQRADWDSNVLVQQPNRFETQKPSVTETGTPHFQEIRKERRGQEHPSATSAAFHAPANADGSLQL